MLCSAPAAGPSGTFPGNTLTTGVAIDSSGAATSPTFTANATAGGPYNVIAGGDGFARRRTCQLEFVQRPLFIEGYPTTLTPAQFVANMNTTAGFVLSATERATAVDLFGGAVDSSNVTARARALRMIVADPDFYNAEYNRAFVLAEYLVTCAAILTAGTSSG